MGLHSDKTAQWRQGADPEDRSTWPWYLNAIYVAVMGAFMVAFFLEEGVERIFRHFDKIEAEQLRTDAEVSPPRTQQRDA